VIPDVSVPLAPARGRLSGITRLGVLAGLAVLSVLGVAACAPEPVRVDEVKLGPEERRICEQLRTHLPGRVLGGEPRTVQPESAADIAAAWGEPAIVLRCGVPEPAALEPSSPCLEVEGVGWFSEESRDSFVFTTIGRRTFVEVRVPHTYDAPSGALVDVAAAVERAVPAEHACS